MNYKVALMYVCGVWYGFPQIWVEAIKEWLGVLDCVPTA